MTHSHLFQEITLVKSECVSGQESVLAKISDAVHVMFMSHVRQNKGNLGGINHIVCFIDHVHV